MKDRAAIVGMLVIKRELIDKGTDPDRLVRWIAQSVEVLLECELSRLDETIARTKIVAPPEPMLSHPSNSVEKTNA
jgi:hypothetical protein